MTDRQNMHGNRVEESFGMNSKIIFDLLQVKRHSYSHLFPLIDSSSYQIKAARSIYNREELLASQEFLPYFSQRCNLTDEFKDIHGSFQGPTSAPSTDDLSRTAKSDEKQKKLNPGDEGRESFERSHSDDRGVSVTHLEQLYSRCMEREEAAVRSLLLRRLSTPMEITESLSAKAFPSLPSKVVHPRSIWVGCIIDYMVISRRLNVRLVHTGGVFEDVVDGKLLAKVFLLPGKVQKQKVSVKRLHSKSYQRVYFEKFSGPELHTMAIGVKLYLSKGLLKKAQLLSEWTVRLEHVSLIGEHTVWQLFEWGC